jgi:hypothetical protein
MSYQPLNLNNQWTYKQKDGSTYTNSVTGINGNSVTMLNTASNKNSEVQVNGNDLLTNAYEEGNFQVYLKNNLNANDAWEIKFKANGLDSILVVTVKEVGAAKNVEGKDYTDVVFLEGESKLMMNGNLMNLGFFTQWYYAKNVGLILTTSSMGDYHGLVDCTLN